jgi:hypothetical protein
MRFQQYRQRKRSCQHLEPILLGKEWVWRLHLHKYGPQGTTNKQESQQEHMCPYRKPF